MTETAQHLRTIPLFPLATVALFPAVRVPLYIFEPRYREMTEAALEGERVIGMVTVLPEGRTAMAGDPEIHPIGCLGLIDGAKRRPDGTWDIALEGIARFEVECEIDKPEGRLFRDARVRMLDEEAVSQPAQQEEIDRLRVEVHRSYGAALRLLAPQYVDAFHARDFDSVPDDVYVNTVCLSLDIDTVDKQCLLECPGTRARLERVLAVLEFKIAELNARGSATSKTLQ
ncbi:MAG: LON peptidase substrate-binding domain-containing protein [Myxococcota bacterium]|nr:LON peptidase substrate-binding domain-containing protein [Myxococcota bacterium]